MDKDQLIAEIARLIVEDRKASAQSWDKYALIAFHGHGGVSKLNGFRYTGDGAGEPATPESFEIEDRLDELREATRIDDKPGWDACVFKLDRATSRVTADFAYDDADTWEVTPATAAAIAERARPS